MVVGSIWNPIWIGALTNWLLCCSCNCLRLTSSAAVSYGKKTTHLIMSLSWNGVGQQLAPSHTSISYTSLILRQSAHSMSLKLPPQSPPKRGSYLIHEAQRIQPPCPAPLQYLGLQGLLCHLVGLFCSLSLLLQVELLLKGRAQLL